MNQEVKNEFRETIGQAILLAHSKGATVRDTAYEVSHLFMSTMEALIFATPPERQETMRSAVIGLLKAMLRDLQNFKPPSLEELEELEKIAGVKRPDPLIPDSSDGDDSWS